MLININNEGENYTAYIKIQIFMGFFPSSKSASVYY